MNNHPTYDQIVALAPPREPLDQDWSAATLARIVATPVRKRRRPRARIIVGGLVGGVIAVTASTAVAGIGPGGVVKDAILDFSQQPNTSGNGLGRLEDPELVAKFRIPRGVFAVWVATSSTGKVCDAETDGSWDGVGVPRRSELEYGCNPMIVDPVDPDHAIELTRPDQLGGFFKDDDGPIIYGVAPYAQATRVRVQGVGIDRELPVRADSHGYGDAIPEAAGAAEVSLTFFDAAGQVVGTKRLVAPVG